MPRALRFSWLAAGLMAVFANADATIHPRQLNVRDGSSGRPPGFGDPQAMLGVTWILTLLAIIIASCRFWVRCKVYRTWLFEDWVMILAVLAQISYQIFVCLSYVATDPITVRKWWLLNGIPGMLVSLLARTSGAILLYRIFKMMPLIRVYLVLLTLMQFTIGILYLVALYGMLDPMEALWNPEVPAKLQIPPTIINHLNIPMPMIFCFADLTYVLVPAIVAYKFNLSFRRKVGLGFIILLTLVPLTAGIIMITGGYETEITPWVLFLSSSFEQTFDIIIASLIPLMPIAKWDYPIIKASLGVLDKAESAWSHVFRSKTGDQPDPSFVATGRRGPSVHAVRTIGSQPVRNILSDASLFSNVDESRRGTDSTLDVSGEGNGYSLYEEHKGSSSTSSSV